VVGDEHSSFAGHLPLRLFLQPTADITLEPVNDGFLSFNKTTSSADADKLARRI